MRQAARISERLISKAFFRANSQPFRSDPIKSDSSDIVRKYGYCAAHMWVASLGCDSELVCALFCVARYPFLYEEHIPMANGSLWHRIHLLRPSAWSNACSNSRSFD